MSVNDEEISEEVPSLLYCVVSWIIPLLTAVGLTLVFWH